MKNTKLALLILLSLPTFVHAEGTSFYGGLGYGYADYEGEQVTDVALLPGQRSKDNVGSYELYIGYQVSQYLSAEFGYARFEKINTQYALDPNVATFVPVNTLEEIDLGRYSLGLLFELPTEWQVSGFGLVGYSYFDMDRKISGGFSAQSGGLTEFGPDSEEGMFWGFGGRYRISETLSARAQWTNASASNLDMGVIRFSLEMRFGQH